MEVLEIERAGGPHQGEYRALIDGKPSGAKLSWIDRGGHRVALSTYVPPELREHGIAFKLVTAMIEDARLEGFKIVPQCSYVAAKFDQHPEWAELRA
ncbi:MAG TPA: GNAT family N-acetyltransferase [Sphingomonadaceae bacterium]|nr:GNAT family N-acetyltransferase [Sphingomonadaceae bacterium]